MHDTLLWKAPREISEERILRSADFVKTGVRDSITFGMKRQARDAEENYLHRMRVLLLKRVCTVAARMALPNSAKVAGSRAVRALQR
jgi:hypothetical protein